MRCCTLILISVLLHLSTTALETTASPLNARSSVLTLPFVKRVNTTGSLNLLARDRARAQHLRARSSSGVAGTTLKSSVVGSVPATDQTVDYVVNVLIGSPPTTYSLLVDTGSSNTWVGSSKPYRQTQTSVQTPNRVAVSYGGFDHMAGTEFTDQVSFGSGLTVFGQSIGAATDSEGFDDCDGILGLGPRGLTIGTLSQDKTSAIETVTDSLFAQGSIPQNLVAISFEPSSAGGGIVNGELTFGGTDASKFIGSINFVPVTLVDPSNMFWGFNQQIRYRGPSPGTGLQVLSLTSGIVDTRTTFTLIASDAFTRYQVLTGAAIDPVTGLLSFTLEEFEQLQSLFFTIGGVVFEFTANAQIWPRALNEAIGGDDQHLYLVINDIGADVGGMPTGSGLDFINGMTWIERFYVVLDTTNARIGVANTPFTRATSN